MNILTDKLPHTVRVGNSVFQLNTDFRAGVAFEMLVESGETSEKLLYPFFPDGLPHDIAGATAAVLWFYRCGEEQKETTERVKHKRAYSFAVDSGAIYADFRRFYGIDLSVDGLHWWAFRSLLIGLPEDSNFKQRVYYRTCDLKDLPKKERDRITKIRKQIEIKEEEATRMTLKDRDSQMREYIKRRITEQG